MRGVMSISAGILSWLGGPEKRKRRATRFPAEGLKGCYWDGGESSGRPVKDISSSGAYLFSQTQFYVGTVLTITLQKEGEPCTDNSVPNSMTVRCKVIRVDKNGMGVSFMLEKATQKKELAHFLKKTATSS